MTSLNLKAIEPHLGELDAHLILRSYIIGFTLSRADLWVWGALRSNRVAHSYIKQGLMVNLSRWFSYIEESEPWVAEAVLSGQTAKLSVKEDKSTKESQDDAGASYDIGLQDVEKGVVTRFPPEPSGYLHIGHAKAAVLNDYFAHVKYTGKLLLRFDDTNPIKEKQEFEDAIIEDLALMGITPDKTSHTSDYFKELYENCIEIIKSGNAYADDTEQETMRAERMDGIASKRRDTSVEDNLSRFREMTEATEEGKRWCIRAKVSVDDPNKAMRDPVIYRCSPEPHHRTGSTYKVYPTYDFACPLIDALEGVTHALRTTEYKDRDAQYQWFIKTMNLRGVYNWDFARLNLVRTLLSKRKLTKFVDTGFVWGWDDPRMPTIRGIRRRGMTIPALREYILKQGPSRNIVNLDWTTFWATNKKHIDPIACRYTAVTKASAVPVNLVGARAAPYTEEKDKSPNHAKEPLGMKKVVYSRNLLIDQEDAQTFVEDEEITLMNWGNAIVKSISHSLNPFNRKEVTAVELELHLQGDVKKTKKKVTWLSKDQELIPVELIDFDFLITKDKIEEGENADDFLNPKTIESAEALADCNVAELKENDIIQFDRKGYVVFIVEGSVREYRC